MRSIVFERKSLTSARNCERNWNGTISFFGWASMGLPYCPVFFTSLFISPTNSWVLARFLRSYQRNLKSRCFLSAQSDPSGYDECLLYGNDQAKLKVFRVGSEWLGNNPVFFRTTYHFWLQMIQLIFCSEKLCWNQPLNLFLRASFFFNFFLSWKNRQTKSPEEKLFQAAIFPGRRTVVFEHASASVNRIQQMWWDVTLVPWYRSQWMHLPGMSWYGLEGVCYITPQKKQVGYVP